MNTSIIVNEIECILKSNASTVLLPIKQRAKFEGWLKVELATKLPQPVAIEYPLNSGKRSPLVDLANTSKNSFYIELKTVNTNYVYPGIVKKTRPITNNIASVVNDINKLRTSGLKDSFVAFVLYPYITSANMHINKVVSVLGNNNCAQKIVNIGGVGGVDILIFAGKI